MVNERIKLFVPRDTTACSLGADEVARLLEQYFDQKEMQIEIIRNGSRGLYWLEPMIEVDSEKGRIAYGPIKPQDVEDFIAQSCWEINSSHPFYLGPTEEIPYLKKQERVTFSRVGKTDPLSIRDFKNHDGFLGLTKALVCSSQDIVTCIKESGLRGRGGAAFPTGIKWQTVLDASSETKYIVCNADEGDSGTFSDRMLMESDPLCLIEGMTIAGLAVGASKGYIYLREEYPLSYKILKQAITLAKEQNYLGENVLQSGMNFDIEIRLGAGAYICGEETSMLESLEGKRGEVRPKPPLPAIKGLFGKPTVINNVITFASIPSIVANGASSYEKYGMGRSRGTLPFQLAGNIKHAGLIEISFGATLRDLLFDFGGGTRTGRPMRAVQVGGPLGSYLSEKHWNTPLDYESFSEIDAMLGHGGVVVFDDSVDMSRQARFSMEFCTIESCGKCTPCRIGSVRGVELLEKIIKNENVKENRDLLIELCDTMEAGSLCAMGGMTPFPVRSALKNFSEDFN